MKPSVIRRAAAALSGACLVVVLIAPPQAEACSCVGVKMGEAFRKSDAAIIGKLRDVRRIDGAASMRGGEGPVGSGKRDFIYRVRRVYKGGRRIEVGTRLAVRSSSSGTSCGLPRRRVRIGLFLDRKRRHWTSNLCSTVTAESMRRAGEGRAAGLGRTAPCLRQRPFHIPSPNSSAAWRLVVG
jgi:hypothetical protein